MNNEMSIRFFLYLSAASAILFFRCGDDDNVGPENEAPTITAQSFNVSEAEEPGKVFGTVTAKDAEEDELTFSIKTNDEDLFSISNSGDLSLASGKSLDFETKNKHVITVSASDGELSASADITITVTDINENVAPDIQAMMFTVPENITSMEEIGVLVATDADGDKLTFSLKEPGIFDGLFTLSDQEEKTVLKLAEGKMLDYETTTSYSLTVVVSDGMLSAEGMVDITVEDVDEESFITKWETTVDNQEISMVTDGSYTYSYDIDWGDGTIETGLSEAPSHQYINSGTYEIAIRGRFPAFSLNDNNDAIQEILQWGTIEWQSMKGTFSSCSNVISTAKDTPDLSSVTDMEGMFSGASSFNGDLSRWDVSAVTNMRNMFAAATSFNGSVSTWNTSSVRDMSQMFSSAVVFNQEIGSWNVENVVDMSRMFDEALVFNQDIGGWNVKSVENMSGMFDDAYAFNQDIGSWKVGSVTNMSGMLSDARSFNQDLSQWDVSEVTNMSFMFSNALVFNQNIGAWDLSSVRFAGSMLNNCALSIANYALTLEGWSEGPNTPNNIEIGVQGLKYCERGETAREMLIDDRFWRFVNDDFASNEECNNQ
ncbi:BspA family leucine-rich repeat surface protein [Fulvivirga sp. M361]|nr:BspA family leucine-rich repeat surface protein [Fulvivirga sp. M361]